MPNLEEMRNFVESAWSLPPGSEFSPEQKAAVESAVSLLDRGEVRVATPTQRANGETTWQVNEWLKKAILVYFRLQRSQVIEGGKYFDKVPVKSWSGIENVRVVPPATVRYGSFIESGSILMPSYVNIGARVGSGTMVDTWATVGSCAQIGRNVHLSGGVGIGGVLEPVQASPIIIEDEVFVGSRCVIVEGVVVEKGAVIGAGCVITASTPIIDVTEKEEKIYKGRIPAYSVVIPGSRTKTFNAGSYQLPCTLIIGKRSANTDLKTSLTSALRDFQISV